MKNGEKRKKVGKKLPSPKNFKTGFWWWTVGGYDGRPRLSSGEKPSTLSEMSFFVQLLPGTPTHFLYREEVVEKKKVRKIEKIF